MRGEGPIPADQQDEGRGRPNPKGYLYIYKMEPNNPLRIADRW